MALARVLFKQITFGKADEQHSILGSDFNSQVVEHLNLWFGIRHVVAPDRHTGSGSEGTINGVLRHDAVIAYDERLPDVWSEPERLPVVQYVLKDPVNARRASSRPRRTTAEPPSRATWCPRASLRPRRHVSLPGPSMTASSASSR